MLFETYGQAYVFLATLYSGLCTGLLYDVNRTLRMLLKRPSWMRHVIDCAFWLTAGALFAVTVLRASEGRLRLYTALGFAVGWTMYALAMSPFIMRMIRLLLKRVNALAQRIMKTRFIRQIFR